MVILQSNNRYSIVEEGKGEGLYDLTLNELKMIAIEITGTVIEKEYGE